MSKGRRSRNSKYSPYSFVDMTGTRCHRWICIRPAGKDPGGQWKWECRCDCGNLGIVRGGDLRSGGSKSCGCWAVKSVSKHVHKDNDYPQRHKYSMRPIYKVWSTLIERYVRSKPPECKITICKEWENDPVKCCDDLIELGWKKGMEIELKPETYEWNKNNIFFYKNRNERLKDLHARHHPEYRNLEGKRFGALIVVKMHNTYGRIQASCICDCGKKEHIVNTDVLVNGRVKTCGCKYGGKWSMYHDSCQECKRTDRRHHSRGICTGCRSKLKKSGRIDLYKATKKPYTKKCL